MHWFVFCVSTTLLVCLSLPLVNSEACSILPWDSPCHCEVNNQKVLINCRNLNLTEVPEFEDVQEVYDKLTLADNDIETLENWDFQFLKVRSLEITENPITAIESNAFYGTLSDSLEELILQVDGITTSGFPAEPLSHLSTLKSLRLRDFKTSSLPSHALTGLRSLTELHFENCGLEQLRAGDFLGQQTNLLMLNLTDNKFRSIPSAALKTLKGLQKLILVSNAVDSLQSDAFQGMGSLLELDLSQNRIGTVDDNAFRGLEESLTTLLMGNCGLQQDHLTPMKNLEGLQTLDLGHNDISDIPRDFFAGLSNLEAVIFASNRITSLSPDSFFWLNDTIRELYFQNNRLTSIRANTFDQLHHLLILDLSSQAQPLAGQLTDDIFQGVEDTLKWLGLEKVGFKQENGPVITNLKSLQTLDLRSNQLQSVPDGTFQRLRGLKNLILSSNQLTTMTQAKMHGPEHSLESLRLDDNKIRVMDRCVVSGFERLRHLDLHDNPLQCDCQLRWLREWTLGLLSFDQEEIQWSCDSPREFRGSSFMSLDRKDFQCSNGDVEQPECIDYNPQPTGKPDHSISPQRVSVQVDNTTKSAIIVSWSATGPGIRDIDGFKIEYHEDQREDLLKTKQTDRHTRRYYITNLRAGTLYHVCVAIVDSSPNRVSQETCVEATTRDKTSGGTVITVSGVLGAMVLVATILLANGVF